MSVWQLRAARQSQKTHEYRRRCCGDLLMEGQLISDALSTRFSTRNALRPSEPVVGGSVSQADEVR